MSIVIDPCGCDESVDLTRALEIIKKARHKFVLNSTDSVNNLLSMKLLVNEIDKVTDVLAIYEFARGDMYGSSACP